MAGKYFEEFSVGQVFKHQPGRTITEMDNVLFTTLTMNPQPLHLDEEFAKQTEFGQRLVNHLLTLGIAVGLSVADTTLGTTIANHGFDKIDFPKPVFQGIKKGPGLPIIAKDLTAPKGTNIERAIGAKYQSYTTIEPAASGGDNGVEERPGLPIVAQDHIASSAT